MSTQLAMTLTRPFGPSVSSCALPATTTSVAIFQIDLKREIADQQGFTMHRYRVNSISHLYWLCGFFVDSAQM